VHAGLQVSTFNSCEPHWFNAQTDCFWLVILSAESAELKTNLTKQNNPKNLRTHATFGVSVSDSSSAEKNLSSPVLVCTAWTCHRGSNSIANMQQIYTTFIISNKTYHCTACHMPDVNHRQWSSTHSRVLCKVVAGPQNWNMLQLCYDR